MPASLNFTDKKLSRELLKGVKKHQWIDSLNRKGDSYFNLSDVTKTTDKAMFISTQLTRNVLRVFGYLKVFAFLNM